MLHLAAMMNLPYLTYILIYLTELSIAFEITLYTYIDGCMHAWNIIISIFVVSSHIFVRYMYLMVSSIRIIPTISCMDCWSGLPCIERHVEERRRPSACLSEQLSRAMTDSMSCFREMFFVQSVSIVIEGKWNEHI